MTPGSRTAVTVGLLPIVLVLGMAVVIVVLGRGRPRHRLYRALACMALMGAVAAGLIEAYGLRHSSGPHPFATFAGGLIIDRFSIFCSVVAAALGLLACAASEGVVSRYPSRAAAFHATVLVATAATMALAGERGMTVLLVAVQLLIACSVVLLSLAKAEPRVAAVASGYAVRGGFAAAVLLYGLAILYGLSGRTDFGGLALTTAGRLPLALGIALTLVGAVYLLGVFPWQRWVLDAMGSPDLVAGLVLAFGSLGGAALYARVVAGGLGDAVRPALGFTAVLVGVVVITATFASLRERDVRRLVAYQVSSHNAFVLMAVLGFGAAGDGVPARGLAALLVAAALGSVSILAVYGLLGAAHGLGVGRDLADLPQLRARSGPLALLLILSVMNLAGFPPLAGFLTRLLIVEAAVSSGYTLLAVVVTATWLLGLVPVLAMVVAALGDEPSAAPRVAEPLTQSSRTPGLAVAAAAALVTLAVGLIQPLLMAASAAAASLPAR